MVADHTRRRLSSTGAGARRPIMLRMIVTTTENIAGYEVERAIGQVFGLIVRSRGLAGNITAAFRSIGGGEIHEYTQMLEDSRRQAIDRMVQNATAMGANAIVMMRFDSSELGQSMAEVVAYGTAVVLRESPPAT